MIKRSLGPFIDSWSFMNWAAAVSIRNYNQTIC